MRGRRGGEMDKERKKRRIKRGKREGEKDKERKIWIKRGR